MAWAGVDRQAEDGALGAAVGGLAVRADSAHARPTARSQANTSRGSALGHSKTGTAHESRHDLKKASLEWPQWKEGALPEARPKSCAHLRSAPTTLSWSPSALTCLSPRALLRSPPRIPSDLRQTACSLWNTHLSSAGGHRLPQRPRGDPAERTSECPLCWHL